MTGDYSRPKHPPVVEPLAGHPGPTLFGRAVDPPLTGVNSNGRHAVDFVYRSADGQVRHGITLCENRIDIADQYGPFDRDRWDYLVCRECAWLLAIRTGTTAAEAARLHDPHIDDPATAGLAGRVAAAILTGRSGLNAGHEPDDPLTIQLLCTVSAHAPISLLAVECLERECGHHDDHDNADDLDDEGGICRLCPVLGVACPTCSVRAGGWAGEGEGRYLHVVPGPCGPLRVLAADYAIDADLPTSTTRHGTDPTPADEEVTL